MTKHTRELLGTATSCFGCYGLFLSFGGGLAQTDIARYLLIAGFGFALLVLLIDMLKGRLVRSIVGVTLWCILGLGVGYFPVWYFQSIIGDGPVLRLGTTVQPTGE